MDGENRARLKNAVDKGIAPLDVSAGTEMPPPLRANAPMNPNPHGHPLGPPRASTPAREELGKLGDAQRAGVQEYLDRK